MKTANIRSGKTTILLLSVLAVSAFLVGTALGQGNPAPVAVTLSTAPDSPGPQTAAPSDVNILVLGIDLAFAQAASGEVKKLAFTLEEMVGAPEGTVSGITSVSLFVNTTGLGWTDPGTTLVATRPCDGAKANFPNLQIAVTTAMRFYLRIDGFDPAQAWDGRTYTFSIDAKAVHIHKKKDFEVTGSVMGSPLTISTKPAPPVITSPEDGSTLTTTDVAVDGTAAPDSTVRVYEGTSLLGTGTATPTGTFQVLLTGLAQGDHSIFATAEKNGATSDPSATVSFSIDAEGPTVASVTPEDAATDVHIHIHVVLTFSEPLDPATVVSSNIFLSKAGTPVDGFIYYEAGSTQMTLSFEDGLDVETAYTVNVTAGITDVLGNPATPFQSTFTTGTTPPPAPVILLPADGAFIEDTRTPTISGTADPGATVRIYDNATYITETTADPVTGAWSQTLVTDLEDGAYHFRARAVGSLSNCSNTVSVEMRRDTDGDGLSDADEVNIYGTDPGDSDTDLDGLSDGLEIEIGSNPLLIDSNNDGWSDGYAYGLDYDVMNADLDGDGILNGFDPEPTVPDLSGGSTDITWDSWEEATLLPRGNTFLGGINVATGEFVYSHDLFAIPVGQDVATMGWTHRTMLHFDGPFGKANESPWFARLTVEVGPPPGTAPVEIWDGRGHHGVFMPMGTPDEYITPNGWFCKLSFNMATSCYEVEHRHGETLNFNAEGRLNYIENRWGEQFVLNYFSGYLDSIVVPGVMTEGMDEFHRMIDIVNYGTGRIQYVRYFEFFEEFVPPEEEVNEYLFIYDVEGRLTSVRYPHRSQDEPGEHSTWSFGYNEFDQVTSFVDPNGNETGSVEYGPPTSNPRAVAEHHRWLQTTIQTYPTYTRGTVAVSSPVGPTQTNTIDYHINGTGTVSQIDEQVGTNTYTTYCYYDSHGSLTRTVFPRENEILQIWQTEHADPRMWGNLLVRMHKTIPGGSEQDISHYWTYEDRFQFMKTYNSPRELEDGDETDNDFLRTYFYDYEEALHATDYNGDGIVSQAWGNVVKRVFPSPSNYTPAQVVEDMLIYDGQGRQKDYIDPDQETESYEYDRWSNISAIIVDSQNLALKTQYRRDWFGNVISKVDPKWENATPLVPTWSYVYDSWSRIIESKAPYPLEYRTIYARDSRGLVQRKDVENRDRFNNSVTANPWFTTQYEYDLNYNLIREIEEINPGLSVVTGYAHDGKNRLVEVVLPRGNKKHYVFDERNEVIQIKMGAGSVEEAIRGYTYDANRDLVEIMNPREFTTVIMRDGFGRKKKRTDALGQCNEWVYDLEGNVVEISAFEQGGDAPLKKSVYRYDELNRLYQRERLFIQSDGTDRGWSVTQYRHNPEGHLVVRINPNGYAMTLGLDTADRLVSRVDALSNETEYIHDENGNIIELHRKDFSAFSGLHETFVTKHYFDVINRRERTEVIDRFDSLNIHATKTYYDSRGNVVYTEDAEGNTKEISFDGVSREIRTDRHMRDSLGSIYDTVSTFVFYNGNGSVSGRRDPKGNVTSYFFNQRDERVMERWANGAETVVQRDHNGNAKVVTNPNGNVVTNTFDALDRLTSRVISLGSGVVGTTAESYSYDGLGRPEFASNDYSQVSWAYDTLSNSDYTTQGAQGFSSKSIAYRFDANSNVTELTPPGETQAIQYDIDALDRIDKITYQGSQVCDYSFTGRRFKSPRFEIANGLVRTIEYDGFAREERRTWPGVADFENEFNKVGMRKKETRHHLGGQYAEVEMDSLYRIETYRNNVDPVSGEAEMEESFTYDKAHNRLKSKTEDRNGAENSSYSSNAMNQYASVNGIPFQYDANGNLINDGEQTYAYSYKNELMRVERVSDGKLLGEYVYDTTGRRCTRHYWDANSCAYKDIQYVYDGWQAIEEHTSDGSIEKRKARFLYGNGIDEPILLHALDENDLDGDTVTDEYLRYFYHRNYIWSISHISDSSGSIVERYDYSAFGKLRIIPSEGEDGVLNSAEGEIGCSIVGNSYGFQGRRFDSESNLYYFRSRHYALISGRFLQSDRRGIWHEALNTGNGYSFPSQNPWSVIDPYGYGLLLDFFEKVVDGGMGDARKMEKEYEVRPAKLIDPVLKTEPKADADPLGEVKPDVEPEQKLPEAKPNLEEAKEKPKGLAAIFDVVKTTKKGGPESGEFQVLFSPDFIFFIGIRMTEFDELPTLRTPFGDIAEFEAGVIIPTRAIIDVVGKWLGVKKRK